MKRAERRGCAGKGFRRVFQAQTIEDLVYVGPHGDAGANFPQGRRLFIDGGVETALLKRNGGGHAAQAGADDADVRTVHDWPCP